MTTIPLQQTLCNGLLYGLKLKGNASGEIWTLRSVDMFHFFHLKGSEYWRDRYDFKPILRRLSVQEIYSICSELMLRKEVRPVKIFIEKVKGGAVEYWQMDILFKYHFNVFNLHEDQYIPANNNFNPYK